MESITFGFAEPGDESEVTRLLSECQLPIEGITPHLHDFILARSQSTIIGVIGLELYERVALLRSMAVASDFRRTGIGTALYERMLAHAHTLNIRELYLLTTTAGDFFTRRGFMVMERNLAPEALRSSIEFRKLCPDSAICMVKQTGGEAVCFTHELSAKAIDAWSPVMPQYIRPD